MKTNEKFFRKNLLTVLKAALYSTTIKYDEANIYIILNPQEDTLTIPYTTKLTRFNMLHNDKNFKAGESERLLFVRIMTLKNKNLANDLLNVNDVHISKLPLLIRLYEDLGLMNNEFNEDEFQKEIETSCIRVYGTNKKEPKSFKNRLVKKDLPPKYKKSKSSRKTEIPKKLTAKEKKVITEVKANRAKNAKEKVKYYGGNKNRLVKKEEIFVKSTGFGTLGEALGVVEVVSENEIDSKINLNRDQINEAYFKTKLETPKKEHRKEKIESLVLWDMENISYYDDYSTITRYVKSDNQIRLMAFNTKHRNYEYKERMDFLLQKLKKRSWVIRESKKKIADDILIESFHKYKESLKELIIISNDSDFQEILKEANFMGIKTVVMYRNNHNNFFHWYEKAMDAIDLSEVTHNKE